MDKHSMMDRDSLFFALLRIGLGMSSKLEENRYDDNSAGDLSIANCRLSIAQGVGAFLFDGLQKAAETGMLPADAASREVKMQLFSHTMQVERVCRMQYAKAAELAGIYAGHGIRTVVLKGIAAGQCYPKPLHRPCGDLDCYLPGDYERGNDIARELGAEVDDHSYKHSHIEYQGLVVENHQFCTPISGCRRTKRFERLIREILAQEGTTRIGQTHLENPSPMWNALFLTFHGRNHFLTDGIALRHLCDWAMLLHKHGAEIDWERFCHLADEFGLRKFADTMTRLSAQYLGVDIPEGYSVADDKHRDAYLMDQMLQYGSQTKSKGRRSLWCQRLRVLVRMKSNRQRYRMFSDVSFERRALTLAYGLFFDRYPRL